MRLVYSKFFGRHGFWIIYIIDFKSTFNTFFHLQLAASSLLIATIYFMSFINLIASWLLFTLEPPPPSIISYQRSISMICDHLSRCLYVHRLNNNTCISSFVFCITRFYVIYISNLANLINKKKRTPDQNRPFGEAKKIDWDGVKEQREERYHTRSWKTN